MHKHWTCKVAIGSSSVSYLSIWSPHKVPDVRKQTTNNKKVWSILRFPVRKCSCTECIFCHRMRAVVRVMTKCLHTYSMYAPLLRICTRKEAFPWVYAFYSGGLCWFVHIASVSICQNQTTIDLPCSELWSLVWLSPRLCSGTKGDSAEE